MKRAGAVFLMMLALCGCAALPDYETVSDVYLEATKPDAREITILLPEEAAAFVMESDGEGKQWVCDNYTVSITTLPSGDMDATLREVTGHGGEMLPVVCVSDKEIERYECVWVSAGEGGDQMNRAVILDDGFYHYALMLQTSADLVGTVSEEWDVISRTFRLNIAP